MYKILFTVSITFILTVMFCCSLTEKYSKATKWENGGIICYKEYCYHLVEIK